jgi:hypothetical protein
MDKLTKLAKEMALEKCYGTTYTYRFEELDAISQAAACRFAQIERGSIYTITNPIEVFKNIRFHADGTRAHPK